MNAQAFWYASRATGVVALLLLTATFALGIAVTKKGRLPGLPGFAITGLHRAISLLAVCFLVVHVLTAVLDTYVRIPVLSAVVPGASGYERFWLSLGAIATDLMIAMIITSLLRGRLNPLLWRVVHVTAYLSWPVALAHSVGSANDLRQRPLALIGIGCALVVVIAIGIRLAGLIDRVPRAQRVAHVLGKVAR